MKATSLFDSRPGPSPLLSHRGLKASCTWWSAVGAACWRTSSERPHAPTQLTQDAHSRSNGTRPRDKRTHTCVPDRSAPVLGRHDSGARNMRSTAKHVRGFPNLPERRGVSDCVRTGAGRGVDPVAPAACLAKATHGRGAAARARLWRTMQWTMSSRVMQ